MPKFKIQSSNKKSNSKNSKVAIVLKVGFLTFIWHLGFEI